MIILLSFFFQQESREEKSVVKVRILAAGVENGIFFADKGKYRSIFFLFLFLLYSMQTSKNLAVSPNNNDWNTCWSSS